MSVVRERKKCWTPGPHGFAVRISAVVWRALIAHGSKNRSAIMPAHPTLPRPSHPFPTFVTMANAPLEGRDGGVSRPDLGRMKIGIFSIARLVDIQLKPLALTPEQCIEYRLPRTPIKASDLRAPNFEARFGAGATELDALEALHPGVLHDILVAEIERYIDADLDDNVQDAVREVEDELRRVTSEVQQWHADEMAALDAQRKAINRAFERVHEPAHAVYREAVARAYDAYTAAIEQARDEIEQMQQHFVEQAERLLAPMSAELADAAPDMDLFDWPEAAEADEDDDPLYNSRRSYVEQVDRFRKHQGKDIEVTLSRDRMISKICIECGNSFSTFATNRKVCGPDCLEKRGYRVRKERNPLDGQKSKI
ncbi:hypothetical protein [Bradyrhizobium sp. Ash2021]|uniref:hypothetical protein n=1 Tax=Bradyrhizobium sp. Ash2021 TaxID=2954771 RepID=UPI00281634C6|nr:hypothetical protein [Bradyrhizobium sp. Ash2021]WMT79501.1 hypothetical protein NL528_46480 [Bradyrhizobium sp. Ash2021]